MKSDGKVIFVENSNYSLISVTKLIRIQNFSNFKIEKILFNEKWWKSLFCWKLNLFTNISYKTKKNSHFFNFENFIKFYSMKNDGKVIFVENSIYSLILVTKLKRIKFFSILKISKILFNEKMMEKLFLLKTLSTH